jgi:hypothetical protein
MKKFKLFSAPALLILMFQINISAQNIPTTLSEIYGEDGFTIETDIDQERSVVGSWIQGANMPFPRYYSGSVTFTRNDTLWLYVIGGDTTGGGHATTACLKYNVNTNTWSYIAPLPVPMRTNAATRIGNKIYTMGGFSAPFPSPALDVFFEYNIDTNTWTQLPNIPQTVFFHGAESYEDSLIYIIGGIEYTPSRTEVWLKNIHLYNIYDQEFRPATDMLEATANFGHARWENRLYVTAGLKSYTELWNLTQQGEIGLSDRTQISWEFKANYSLNVHAHYGATYPNNEIYYIGGSISIGFNPINNIFGYHIDTDEYEVEDPAPIPWMAAVGGLDYMNNHRSGVEVITLVVSGGVTTGPTITNQTWVLRDTVDVQGLDEINNLIPSEYSLQQNYPNPFNPSTTIQFSIPEQTFVKLEVFNSLGEKVTTLVSEELSTGKYKYKWNAENLPSGIYFYRIQSPLFSESKKMILIK